MSVALAAHIAYECDGDGDASAGGSLVCSTTSSPGRGSLNSTSAFSQNEQEPHKPLTYNDGNDDESLADLLTQARLLRSRAISAPTLPDSGATDALVPPLPMKSVVVVDHEALVERLIREVAEEYGLDLGPVNGAANAGAAPLLRTRSSTVSAADVSDDRYRARDRGSVASLAPRNVTLPNLCGAMKAMPLSLPTTDVSAALACSPPSSEDISQSPPTPEVALLCAHRSRSNDSDCSATTTDESDVESSPQMLGRAGRVRNAHFTPPAFVAIEDTCQTRDYHSLAAVDLRTADARQVFGGSVYELRDYAKVNSRSHNYSIVWFNECSELRRAVLSAIHHGVNQCVIEYPDSVQPSDDVVNFLRRQDITARRELMRSSFCECQSVSGCQCPHRKRRTRLVFDLLPPVYPFSPASSGSRLGNH